MEIIREIKKAWEEEMMFHGSCVNSDTTTLCVHQCISVKKTHCFFSFLEKALELKEPIDFLQQPFKDTRQMDERIDSLAFSR